MIMEDFTIEELEQMAEETRLYEEGECENGDK